MFSVISFMLINDLPELAGSVLCYILFVVGPVLLVAWFLYYLLSLPMRRQERARFFLDLLKTILREGKPLEQSLMEISNTRDKTPGVRFHLLTAHLENGLRLSGALEKVPQLLPPQVASLLRAGEKSGDLQKVLPVCDYLVRDAESNVRGAVSYLVVIAFALSPFSLFVMNTLGVFVFPKFQEIMADMGAGASDYFLFLAGSMPWLMLVQGCLFVGLVIAAIFYIGGPLLARGVQSESAPFVDWIAWSIPWKRRRLQRNFSMMLAIMLDSGMTEANALRLAADSVANEIFRRRLARAQAALAGGVKLTEAIASLDDTGEFRWRLANAAHAHGGFLRALTGWHEALDAKAFQQEQTAAHTVTTALVLANGLIVATVVTGVFSALISIINAGVLW